MSSAEAATVERDSAPESKPAHETTADVDVAPSARFFASAPAAPPIDRLSRLASSGARGVVMRHTQQAYGNRAAQRVVSLVQRSCACGGTCSTCGEDQARRLVQLQREDGAEGDDAFDEDDDRATVPEESSGEPLHEPTRERMQPRLGGDLADVRVHTDRPANEAADRMHADAFTSGRDIYFAAGQYAPGTPSGDRLIAHELTHTIQQSEGASPQNVAAHARDGAVIGAANDPLEHEADRVADAVVSHDHAAAPAITSDAKPGTVRRGLGSRLWNATGGRAVRLVERGIEAAGDWIIGKIEKYAPGLLAILRGPIDFLKDRIGRALDERFGGFFARVQRDGFFGALGGIFGEAIGGLSRGLSSLVARSCDSVAGAAQAMFDVARSVGGEAFSVLRHAASTIGSFFSGLWEHFGAPAVDAIRGVASAVWDWITEKARWIWNATQPIRDLFMRAWRWLMRQFNLAWEGGAGIIDWLREKARAAWEKIKDVVRPIIGPLRIIVGILLALSPIGPILAIVAAAPYVWRALRWIWDNWGHDIFVRARRVLQEQIIPQLQSALGTLGGLLAQAGAWLRDKAAGLVNALGSLADGLGVSPFLAAARRGVSWLAEQASRLASWVATQFVRFVEAAHDLLSRIWHVIQPFVVLLVKISICVANPWMLPILITSWIWLAMPDCYKPPIIDFILDIMIGVVDAMPSFRSFGETWARVKESILQSLRGVRRSSVQHKVEVANHIAEFVGGSGLEPYSNMIEAARQMPSQFVGQAEEELIGMNLEAPLPFERNPSRSAAASAHTIAGEPGVPAEAATILGRAALGPNDLAMSDTPTIPLEPELLAQLNLRDGEERTLGERNDPDRTLEAVQLEAGGGEPQAEQTAAPASAPRGAMTPEEEIEEILANQQTPPCETPAGPAEQAHQSDIPEALKRGPFTPALRAHFMWEQMKRGMRQWYECHRTAIWVSLIAGLVVLIIAAILSGGAVLEAIPPLLEILGTIMIGVAMVRVGLYVGEYVYKSLSGDVPGAARSLARGIAVGAIELVFALLFNLGSVIKALKGGLRGTLEALESAERGLTTGLRRSTERLRDIARTARTTAVERIGMIRSFFTTGGRIVFRNVERGFARGIHSVGEFVEALFQRLRFRRISISRAGNWLMVWGHINPKMLLFEVPVQLPNAQLIEDSIRNIDDPMLRQIFQQMRRNMRGTRAVAPGPGGVIHAEQILLEGGILAPIGVDIAHSTLQAGHSTQQAFNAGLHQADDALRTLAQLAGEPNELGRRLLALAEGHAAATTELYKVWQENAPREARALISEFVNACSRATNRAADTRGLASEVWHAGRIGIVIAETPQIVADVARLEVAAATRGLRLTRGAAEGTGSWGMRLMNAIQNSYPVARGQRYPRIPWADWERWGMSRGPGALSNQLHEVLIIGGARGSIIPP